MRRVITELHKRNPLLWWLGCLHMVLFVICIGIWLSCKTTVSGANAWSKPVRYSLSAGITLWSLTWFVHYLKSQNIIRMAVWIAGLSATLKILLIIFQSSKGQASHFNQSSPGAMLITSTIMMLDIVFLLAMIVLTYHFFTQKKVPLSQHYTCGVRMGMLNFVVFAFTGILMYLNNSHLIGSRTATGPSIPMLGWNTHYGDLRIAHFMGVHALQIIPVLSYYLFSKKNQVLTFSLLYMLLTLIFLIIALMGMPVF